MAKQLQRDGRLPENSGGGTRLVVIVCFALLVVLSTLSKFVGNNSSNDRPDAASPTQRVADSTEQKQCKAKLESCCIATGIIQTMKFAGVLKVYVHPGMWRQANIGLKNSIAEKVDCAVTDPGMAMPGIQYIDGNSGKVLHVWNGVELKVQ